MGTPLFKFEDDFIDSTCYGRNAGETTEIVAAALEEGRRVLADNVAQRFRGATVELDERGVVVVLPASIEDDVLTEEYGSFDRSPNPRLRQTVIRSRYAMEKVITAGLEML